MGEIYVTLVGKQPECFAALHANTDGAARMGRTSGEGRCHTVSCRPVGRPCIVVRVKLGSQQILRALRFEDEEVLDISPKVRQVELTFAQFKEAVLSAPDLEKNEDYQRVKLLDLRRQFGLKNNLISLYRDGKRFFH
ncbi:unnamed protein product [Gongylonema pulchrum]|uniref:Transposase n=1 Tax=Gongylonema pulchrum TaxID=637853 RepID=A0A183EE80_9BILA|nr:unnamed protein product [Gongylonema pulchrum]